jgi:Xaa-Pro aminopeptidase
MEVEMATHVAPKKSKNPNKASDHRLAAVRQSMAEASLDFLIVRATDIHSNEYVPADQSLRQWATGFTGSMGDAVIGRGGPGSESDSASNDAWLVVDGRYALQAKKEAPGFKCRVIPLGTSIEEGWLNLLGEIATPGQRVGVDKARVSSHLYGLLKSRAESLGLELHSTVPNLVEAARKNLGQEAKKERAEIRVVSAALSGQTALGRLKTLRTFLDERGLDGLCVFPLDEIAWLTNLRGLAFPYQATFPARCLILKDAIWLGTMDAGLKAGQTPEPGIHLLPLDLWQKKVEEKLAEDSFQLALDPASVPAALVGQFRVMGASVREMKSPIPAMRAQKTPEELAHMRSAFHRADAAVRDLTRWLNKRVKNGKKVTEKDVDKKIRALFEEAPGNTGLSFRPICASGKNGAVIHYGTPDGKKTIKPGTLFLLDTGAYFEGGYATDLTRTFLVGDKKPKKDQRLIFTLVLKAAIAGMSARFPRGTVGTQLDALVRQPLWQAGLNFGHGTGHGVGINVHESPPRVAPGNTMELLPGHVFSIEPGYYHAGFGGVRIENLCTVVVDPDDDHFLRVQPLTFSPLDQRLIDEEMLTAQEKRFLKWFAKMGRLSGDKMPGLPPTH